MLTRRVLVAGLGSAIVGAVTTLVPGFIGQVPDLDASLRRRYTRRLALPGHVDWWKVLDVHALTSLSATHTTVNIRGHRPTDIWAYRANVSGKTLFNPLLRGRPGQKVRVRFDNHLEQATSIHWHGFSVDSFNDGDGMEPVPPGQRRDYSWRIRNSAGVNWYHPHPHGGVGEQIWRGMSGLFLVDDEASDRITHELGVDFGLTDVPLIIQDRTVQRSGELPYGPRAAELATGTADPLLRASLESLCGASSGASLHGSFGQDILVNMTRFPCVRMPRRWVRFRVLNASNARVYRLAFRQGLRALPFALIGVDAGLLREPREVASVFLAPAERLDVALDLSQVEVGDVWLMTLPFDPMHNDRISSLVAQARGDTSPTHVHGARGEGAEEHVLRIEVVESDGPRGKLPPKLAPAGRSAIYGPGTREFVLDLDAQGRWVINGNGFADAMNAFEVTNGAREVWFVRNVQHAMPHPMHLHGFHFEVLGRTESPQQLLSHVIDAHGRTAADATSKDSVLVWPGETVRLGIDFSHPYEGSQRYMFHCHNLEHEDSGMMLGFRVSV
nr:multicopper oxidase domain-containing protein [uncultured Caldimonas sp.]